MNLAFGIHSAHWKAIASMCQIVCIVVIIVSCGVADGEARARVFTWNDVNGNGKLDANEPPLPWVTISIGYPPSLTDASGKGVAVDFRPGCASNCSNGATVYAVVPPGYRATTPVTLPLNEQSQLYEFGFQLVDKTQRPIFPGEPDWFQAFTNRGLVLTTFHYSAEEKHLAITLQPPNDQDEMYKNTLEVINELPQASAPTLQQVSITVGSHTYSCEMSTLREWAGKISALEIVTTYCQSASPAIASPPAARTSEPVR